ncbi:MAG: GNAT family N-acetyltransferase [Phototrophicaceae bacterium]
MIADDVDRLFQVRPLNKADRLWVAHFLDQHWGSTKVVSRGQSYYAHLLPGFAAELNDAPDDAPPAGLVTYNIDGNACEVLTLNSLQPGMGVGTALLEAVKAAAREAGCRRLWLITTNDNLEALRFFQKRGLELVAVHANALAAARKLKPQIPLVGLHGIPLRDEIELQMAL